MPTRVIRETATELVYQATYEMTVPKIQISSADLPAEDGIPLESNWQRAQMDLLIELINLHWADRTDFYAGGNMFIYYSPYRLKSEDVRGPDFFVVKGTDKARVRRSWIVWEEEGKLPHVIVELVSPSTQAEDEGRKKELYEQTFRTPEYFLYYPDEVKLIGWQLVGGVYQPLQPDVRGWLWSDQLGLWLGTWAGYGDNGEYNTWLRFYEANGRLVPTHSERAAEAEARAEAEAKARLEAEAKAVEAEARIAALEAEIARLKGQQSGDDSSAE
jgi:Uma2 family endonuclease